MSGRQWIMGLLIGVSFAVGVPCEAQEASLIIFDFEDGVQEWVVPEWALTSSDYGGKTLAASKDFLSHGAGSLQFLVQFPGGKWSGAYLERMMYVTDWSPFQSISVDIYLPYNTPQGLKARFILTVGKDWTWTEMNRGIALTPDQWTTITANLKPGSLDWSFFPTDEFRKDVRKIGIRIESDSPAYSGAVYLDHVRLNP